MATELEELKILVKDNNQMLRALRRTQRWSTFFWFFKWAIIIGSAFGLYYYFQPAIDQVVKTYRQVVPQLQETLKTIAPK